MKRRYQISFYLSFPFETSPNMVMMLIKTILGGVAGVDKLVVNEERQQSEGGEWS